MSYTLVCETASGTDCYLFQASKVQVLPVMICSLWFGLDCKCKCFLYLNLALEDKIAG